MYALPLDIPLYLSANYGEIRTNHFHSGIDIKTQGVIGKAVYSIDDGYVSRVFVSPSGFGKALYIVHPDGKTSVYGHVERFSDEIDAYVYEQQYAQKSFRVDLTPPKDQFKVKRGDLVAYSGNRGSSGGPHLHLELRDQWQRPYNMLSNRILIVADTIPPAPVTLYYVEVDTVSDVPVHRVVERITPKRVGKNEYVISQSIQIGKQGYFAVEVSEKKNGTDNPMGVYRMQGEWDGKPYFEMTIEQIPFTQNRFSNTVALYSESRSKRNGVYRLYLSPNNPLSIYKGVVSRGVLVPVSGKIHEVKIRMEDDCGNSSVLAFQAKERTSPKPAPAAKGTPVQWNQDFHFHENGLSVEILANSLYESILFEAVSRPADLHAYSPIYKVHTENEAIQGEITVALDADDLPAKWRNKALLGNISETGTRSSAGGSWKADEGTSGRVEAQVRDFGLYYIAIDTTAPRITPSFKNGENFSGKKTISFVISDDFSGISYYNVMIDGKWALFEHDPKTRRITHHFDDTRWPIIGGKHTIAVTLQDQKGNSATFTGDYIR